jgi:hypothetical protein
MLQPIRSIPSLLYHLASPRVIDPISLLNRYQGQDWATMSSDYPLSLFRNEYMELVLRNWTKGKSNTYYNNYSTVHTKVLQGSFDTVETYVRGNQLILPNKNIKLLIGHTYTFHPFSKVIMVAQEPSTSLQLHYYQNMC